MNNSKSIVTKLLKDIRQGGLKSPNDKPKQDNNNKQLNPNNYPPLPFDCYI